MAQISFAVLLKRARHRAGMTQDALARKAGLTGSYISMIESGRKRAPRPPVVARICKALGVREKLYQEAAALERAPDPIRRKIEKIQREEQRTRRYRDRFLSTTLFHLAHRGPVGAAGSYLDLSPAQRGLLNRLLGRARRARSAEEAERRANEVLEETTPRERDLLARVLPRALAGGEAGEAAPPAAADAQAGDATLPVHADLGRTSEPVGRYGVDRSLWHPQAFLWRVPDDEAYPRVEAGDLLLVDPLAEPKSGDLVALTHEGRDLVRILHRSEDQVRLEPPRPGLLPIRCPAQGFRPAGVVVWMCRGLR